MTEYRVASLLPEHARRAAAAGDYLSGDGGPRTEDGCCPLGLALQACGAPADIRAPDCDEFGQYCIDLGLCDPDPDERHSAAKAASEFVIAWDDGAIPDLAEALGCEPWLVYPTTSERLIPVDAAFPDGYLDAVDHLFELWRRGFSYDGDAARVHEETRAAKRGERA